MFGIKIFHFVFYVASISLTSALFDEMYRPQLHFSPPKGWSNDPIGLVYGNGLYHLFYQSEPNNTRVDSK